MDICLPPDAAGPLYRQVFDTLRAAIVEGRLAAGSRLPATRELANRLAVSRNTVNTAYEMLTAEGYVSARAGSGFYVVGILPDQTVSLPAGEPTASAGGEDGATRRGLSGRGKLLAGRTRPVPGIANPAFQRGLPALDQFPFGLWQQHLARHSRAPDEALLKYRDDGGLPALKAALADYLRLSRGVCCETDQIIIVSGGQAALDLASRLLVDAGDRVSIEEPGYAGARDALQAAGARMLPARVDDKGLCVERIAAGTKLVYVTPSYQFPLGITMSASRRLQLLQWAAENDAWVIEDDYDSEFRYSGRPFSCMQGIDGQQRVVYVGTFSKVMFPGLRLGYLVVPRRLAGAFAAALRKTGQDAPPLIQAAMADFIASGQFAGHIRKMRKLYARRQALFVSLARRHLRDFLVVRPTHAGMQLACRFSRDMDEARVRQLAAARGIDIAMLSDCYIDRCEAPGLLLGYAGIPEAHMEAAVRTLAELLAEAAS